MDQMARRHIESRLQSALRRRANALEELRLFLHQADETTEGDWHNMATTIAMGAAAKGEIKAYLDALAADDASADHPVPPKE